MAQTDSLDQASRALPAGRFSTDFLAERDRVPFIKEEVSKIVSLDIELLDDRPRFVIDRAVIGPATVHAGEITPTSFLRRRPHLRDCNDDFLLHHMVGGWQHVSHRGEEIRVGAGESCLMDNAGAGDVSAPVGGSIICLRLDGAALRALVRHPERSAGRLIARGEPGISLLTAYLRAVLGTRSPLTPELHRSAGLHIIELVATTIGATRDGAAQAEAGGLRAARLNHVLVAIAARACDPRFSVETVATELAVTSRTVQLLLDATGATFSEHVAEHRLRRAWRMLTEPAPRRSIAEIAYEAGFNDLSYFYRAFRRRFGETPAAVRGDRGKLH